jgi:vomeronasal1 receptor
MDLPSMNVVGILGNMSGFVNYMFSWWGNPEKTPIYLILTHLAFTDIIILLTKGLTKAIAAFDLRNFLDDISCEIERPPKGDPHSSLGTAADPRRH